MWIIRENVWHRVAVQQVALLPHRSRVQISILSSGYCLFRVSHVLPSVCVGFLCVLCFPSTSQKHHPIQFLFLLFYTASRRAWRPRTRRAWNLSQVTQGTRCGGHPRWDSIPLRSLTHVHTLETIQDANQPTEHAFGLEEETGVHSGERASERVNVCTGLAWILLPYARCSPNRSQIHRNPDHDKALAYWGWINEY